MSFERVSSAYFGVEGEQDTHRMVFSDTGGAVEVLEVVAVSERTDDLPYLLAGLRLERR